MLPAWIQTYLEHRDEDELARRGAEPDGHPVERVEYIAPCEACGEDAPWTSTLYEIWNEAGFVRAERHESTSHCPCTEGKAA